MYIVHVPLIARLEYRLGSDYGMDYPYKLCVMYSIVGKFGEVLIWRFGGLEKIAKLNSANIKSRGTSQLATQVPGILYTAPALQERYRYTPQRMRCWGFLSLSLSLERKFVSVMRI